ncbi:NADPH-dependent assimilatory sulfite reductase hemoprotein subunit [Synechococcus sp. R6-6]|uniref:NADPH-dependent assimilatory sulfite reductase hemoprotein subunit n=1 Tax=unclassified Synechococcus TaxID=2626047 RepID=UPI0039C31892
MPPMIPSEAKRSKVEQIKADSHFLRDPLQQELAQDTTHFSEAAVQVLKFHGAYQQDDRDRRQQRKQEGLERAYSMMLRTRIPGGHVPPQLYLTLDRLADEYGNGTLRATTRQTFQLHGILKKNLKATIASILKQMGSTLAACGDVNRNVMAPVAPYKNRPAYRYAQEYARKLADLLAPKTSAYYEIWVDGEPVPIPPVDEEVREAEQFVGDGVRLEGPEPLYGPVYLPRKFKTAITVAGENTVDVYSQDLGLIVLTDRKGNLKGFNIVVGGGMGRTHGKEETQPLLAKKLCFAPPESVYRVCQAVLAVQRDYGNRHDRKQARLKYLVRDWGIRKFRRVVEEYVGEKLPRFRPLPKFVPNSDDYLGWHEQGDGRWFLGISIENGRIQDTPERQLKTALRRIVEAFSLHVRLTPTQDLLFIDIAEQQRDAINQILKSHGVLSKEEIPQLVRLSMACPALPTCGLAITESERALPGLVRQLDQLLQELDLQDSPFLVRMTGCPNGCARPYLAELGLVGSAPDGYYQIWLGASPQGDRLAQVFQDRVHISQIVPLMRVLLQVYKQERRPGESFGDYCHRVGIPYLRAQVQQRDGVFA